MDAADSNALQDACACALNLPLERISSVRILRRSLDARQRKLQYEYSLAVDALLDQDELTRVLANPRVSLYQEVLLPPPGAEWEVHLCANRITGKVRAEFFPFKTSAGMPVQPDELAHIVENKMDSWAAAAYLRGRSA